jgi:hypothetical protein
VNDSEIKEVKIGRFDQVRILTTRNVTYLSAPPKSVVSPKGLWSVTSIIGANELLLAKQSALIRIPAADVLFVAGYDVNKITKNLGRLSRGESEKEEGSSEDSEGVSGSD